MIKARSEPMSCTMNRTIAVVWCSAMLVVVLIFLLCLSAFGAHVQQEDEIPEAVADGNKVLHLTHVVCTII